MRHRLHLLLYLSRAGRAANGGEIPKAHRTQNAPAAIGSRRILTIRGSGSDTYFRAIARLIASAMLAARSPYSSIRKL